jgi:hypothetical protein
MKVAERAMRVRQSLIVLLAIAQFGAIAGSLLAKPKKSATPAGEQPIRIWRAVFVDAKTKKPLPDIVVDANVSFSNKRGQQGVTLTSSEAGDVKIPLRKGECTFLNVRGPGWCYVSGWPAVGELPADWYENEPPPAAEPEKPVTVELYPGTDVKGRLLRPDGRPAVRVSLSAGVYCNQSPWVSDEYIRNLPTYNVSDWPNWHAATTTEEDGSFSITVPPRDVRGWIRLGTIQGDFQAIDTSWIEKSDKTHALVQFAPFEVEVNGYKSGRQVDESSGVVELGDLRLSKGIVLRGRVVDAEGRPMSDVMLFTSSPHGPYAGRKAVSKSDGSFEFMPMNAGTIDLSPDAHERDDKGKRNSRDVAAVFIDQRIKLSEDVNPREIIVRALPHVELAFEWEDRRAKKGPVSYYGCFTLTGDVTRSDGSKEWWRGETEKITRGGKELLVVKVPEAVARLTIGLHPDERVTPTYSDDTVQNRSGEIELHDIKRKTRRVIYADDPQLKQ